MLFKRPSRKNYQRIHDHPNDMSPPSTTAGTLRKVASARWLRLPSEPEYSESGRTKEMESYLALKKLLDEDALRKKKANVPESKWGM